MAEEAEAARRAEDERLDREQAAACVSEARERRTWAADGALTRCETEFGLAWACDPPVRKQQRLRPSKSYVSPGLLDTTHTCLGYRLHFS